MPELPEQGVGKCPESHLGSYGFPTRPADPYAFCPQCGSKMVWACAECQAALPDDPKELETANFCRSCGAAYFGR
jgi:predicted RNA-binding Zn-ribbon protein involved in translation (DUF1610 family)